MNQVQSTRTGGPYRSRNNMIFGVCRGLADHLGFSVVAMRIIVVIGTLFTGVWPGMVTYIIAALLMKPEPIVPFDS